MIYKPVKGSTINNEQAQRYGDRITVLEEEDGGVTAEAVLKDAQSKKSPLHDFFEWNDKEAAYNYRIEQARYLLRSINVVVKQTDGEQEVRAFHSVRIKVAESETNGTDSKQAYVSLQRVISDDEWRKQLIEDAFKELEAWRRKYAVYQELAKVVEMVDSVIAQKVAV